MSYSRSYSDVVSKTVTVHYNYPKSDTGGSDSKSVTVEIPVSWDVHVDTSPFDKSINYANRQVNLLTGSIVATETAHIAAKIKSSEDISHSIVNGFFGLIKSEINQQLTEIKPRVDALIIELMQYQHACTQKKTQLEEDFGRISERYAKIFSDLDKELSNRILLLNQSAVGVHGTLTSRVHRSFSDISSGVATIYNKEGSNLQSMLYSTNLKVKALSLINSAKNYLFSEKNLSTQLSQILMPHQIEKVITRQIPIVYFESKNQSNGDYVAIIPPEQVSSLATHLSKLKEGFANPNSKWSILDLRSREIFNTFIKIEVANQESSKESINPRVAKQIMQLWKDNINIQINN